MTAASVCLVAPLPRKDLVLSRLALCTSCSNSDDHSSSSSSSSLDHAREQLSVLRRLETTTYKPQDYYASVLDGDDEASIVVSRQGTVEYLYQVSDFGGFERRVVAYAMTNLLDRYLSTCPATARRVLCDKNRYQWVTLTCLYLTVKLLEPQNIGIESLPPLTNNVYTVQDFIDMESTILRELQWKVAHGPSGQEFVRMFLQYLPSSVSTSLATQLFHQSEYQLELAISDYELCTGSLDSELAMAALWNALEWTDAQELSKSEQFAFQGTVRRILCEACPQDIMAVPECDTYSEGQIVKLQSKLTTLVLGAYSSSRAARSIKGADTRSGIVHCDSDKRRSPVTIARKEALDGCRSSRLPHTLQGKHRQTVASNQDSIRSVTHAELLHV